MFLKVGGDFHWGTTMNMNPHIREVLQMLQCACSDSVIATGKCCRFCNVCHVRDIKECRFGEPLLEASFTEQVHDEVNLQGPIESAERAKAIVVDCMSKPFGSTNFLRVGRSVDSKCA